MCTFIRLFRSDLVKIRHTLFLFLHLLLPFAGALIFVLYEAVSPWNTWSLTAGYLELLGALFPLLGAVVSALYLEQEERAGGYWGMLFHTESRNMLLLSKVLLLLGCGALASVLAVAGYGIGITVLGGFRELSLAAFLGMALVLFVSQMASYGVHFYLAVQWGKGVCMGAGIIELLVSALLATGLGEGVWAYIPCAWGPRLCAYLLVYWSKGQMADIPYGTLGLITAGIWVLVILWFRRFEYRK